MKVTRWTDWDDDRYSEDIPSDKLEEARDAVAKALRDNGYKFDGYYHQGGDCGVPVLDETYKYTCSFRMWGQMMVRAYPDEIIDDDGLGYCDWAWSSPVKPVVPSKSV